MQPLGSVISQAAPANDNAIAAYLDSDAAQDASPSTLLQIVRLARCAPISAETLARLQRLFDSV